MDPSKTQLKWRTSGLREENGILVGTDISQEWLLSWWWKRYEKYNSHPVAFIDFGMSSEKKNWCRERGELIPLRIFEDFIAEKDEIDPRVVTELEEEFGKAFWICRNVWFKKPLGLLQTPFKKTIWIDLDCEIRGSIEKLFTYADLEPGLGMIIDPCDSIANYSYPIYNSGIIPYRRGIPLIIDWALACITKNHQFRGDQEILSNLISMRKIAISLLPPIYNWSRTQRGEDEALILHWHGLYGKYVIRSQITAEEIQF